MSDKTPYDPSFPMFREMLGLHLLARLSDAGFTEEGTAKGERIFSRIIPNSDDRQKIMVYTSISKGSNMVRGEGHDAIRVCGIYKTKAGETRGLVKQRRVHRTGHMEEIGDRMLERMRDTWRGLATVQRCKDCEAPMFTSKAGNTVCAEVCWSDGKPSKDWKSRYNKVKRRRFK